VAVLVFWEKALAARRAFCPELRLAVVAAGLVVLTAPQALALQLFLVLVVFMAAAAAAVLAFLMSAAAAQFVSFGLAQHVHFQAQIQEICNELVYSFKKWAAV
jgi:hypothetical protein